MSSRLKKWLPAVLILAVLTVQAAAAQAGNFIWQVTGPAGQSFVMGSLHLAKPDLYPLAPAFYQAFDRSHALAVEANINTVDPKRVQDWIMANGLYPENDNLNNHLSPRTRSGLEGLGVDTAQLARFHPWLVAVTLQTQTLQAMGFQEQYGLDRHFLDRAQERGMPIVELEGIDFQLDMFRGLSQVEQDLFLYYTLIELENVGTEFNKMIAAWKAGDLLEFERLFFKSLTDNPELAPIIDKVITRRNRTMTDKTIELMRSGKTPFVIVGAGHLIGPEGILNRFKKIGYRVDQQ